MKEIWLSKGVSKEGIYEHPYGDRFLGEVTPIQFIDGVTLANTLGITNGTVITSSGIWLRFLTGEGKTLYVAKQPFRQAISWNQLNERGVVFGDQSIVINGLTYKARLLKGAADNPVNGVTGTYDAEFTWGSEWNRLFYPLVTNPMNTPTYPVSQEGIRYGSWADYSEIDLKISISSGRYCWCQETGGSNRVYRGGMGVPHFGLQAASSDGSALGWRPVLELVE